MKFDIASDLHISQWWNTTQLYDKDGPKLTDAQGKPLYVDWDWYRAKAGNADIVLIAGDCSNGINIMIKTIEHARATYKTVIFTDGNHEHYGKVPYSANMINIATYAEANGVIFLSPQNPIHFIDDVAIVGCNAWYDWRCNEDKGIYERDAYLAWKSGINDYSSIFFDNGDPGRLATLHSDILANTVQLLQNDTAVNKIVVMTHTSPRVELMDWKSDSEWNLLTPSFMNTQLNKLLDADHNKKIKYWIYGHSHTRKTEIIDNITYINNCRGYPKEMGPWFLQQIDV